jgi:MFS family permease
MCKITTENAKAPAAVPSENEAPPLTSAQQKLRKGTIYGALSVALLTLSFSLTMPHMQGRRDELGCDSMCLGSMTSARSTLSLMGSAVIGRWSDSTSMQAHGGARKICLLVGSLATLLGLVIAANTNSLEGMWLSLIPGALFQQNFNVLKALFSDYHDEVAVAHGSSTKQASSDRAASVGLLGMAVGLSFMMGPLAGATILTTFEHSTWAAIIATVLSLILVLRLPQSKPIKNDKTDEQSPSKKSFWSMLNVPAARTPAAILFMSIRVCMAMAFHIFQTIWTASLKSRFDFGPADHGKFMSFIGLTYALSQGFVAKYLLRAFGANTPKDRVRVVLACCAALGLGRYVAFETNSLVVVYAMFGLIVTALGVVNTVLTADTSRLASSEEIGGVFGILAAVENAAGMLGPILGGLLAYIHPIRAPLLAVVGLYVVVFALVWWGYERLVLKSHEKQAAKTK